MLRFRPLPPGALRYHAAILSPLFLLAWLLALLPIAAADARDWPDTPLARVEALAILQSLNAALLSHPSATATLETWCRDHHLAPQARIVARRGRGPDKPLLRQQRVEMQIGAGEQVRYRHVELACGDHVLSVADNWYVPARLTAAMNHRLDTTDTPFGRVVAALHFSRRTLDARLLWPVLPAGWEMQRLPAARSAPLRPPAEVLQHRAVLSRSDGVPFCEVVETYTSAILDFPLPQ